MPEPGMPSMGVCARRFVEVNDRLSFSARASSRHRPGWLSSGMTKVEEQTFPNSPFVQSISRTTFSTAGMTLMRPDNCWDFAIIKRGDEVLILRTGLTTRPDSVEHAAGDEILAISFRASTFMPLLPGDAMLNRGLFLEKFGRADMWIGPDVREIPNFDNADVFVERLVRDGIIANNDLVQSVVDGHSKAMSERTMQRHFLRTTGLTYKRFTLIERAQKAMSLLQMGQPALDVAFALGFTDQAHLINSVKQIMGQTPGEIARQSTP